MADIKQKSLLLPILLGLGALVVFLGFWLLSGYNRLVGLDEEVNRQFANIETQLQRRYDLIPNLVQSVQGAADFERNTFTEVTEARSAWQNAGSPDEKIAASNQLEGALGRLLVTFENYPQLQATQAFRDLNVQLEGTENRISVERTRYNETATQFNVAVRRFPTSIMAGIFGFDRRELFDATPGAENAPPVQFDFE
jgi:LemA protein